MNIEYLEWQIERLKDSVQTAVDSSLAALAARVGLLEQWWDYLYYKYNAEGSEQAGSDGTTVYTETIKDGETVKATRVTTESADGNTFTAVYTIGNNPAKTKTTILTDDSFTEVWS